MAGAVEVRGADEVRQFVGRLPEAIYKHARKAYRDAVLGAQKTTLNRLNGDPIQSRTGTLARSILPEVSGSTIASLVARIYSTAKYAPIHEYGGVVRARDKYMRLPGGPYLNIPTAANKTAAGVMRMGAREVFANGGYIAPISSGYGVFLDGRLMFVLRRQVEIPARLGMIDAAEAEVAGLIEALRNARLDEDPPEGYGL